MLASPYILHKASDFPSCNGQFIVQLLYVYAALSPLVNFMPHPFVRSCVQPLGSVQYGWVTVWVLY